MKTRTLAAVLLLPLFLVTLSCTAQESRQTPSRTERDKSRSHGWLGVRTEDMTHRLARELGVKTTEGALVREVLEDTPAEKAGLKEDDIIVEFNGKKIGDAEDLSDAVSSTAPGTAANAVLMRNDESKTVAVTVGRAPRERALTLFGALPRMNGRVLALRGSMFGGLSVEDLSGQLGTYFEAPNGKGVLVANVEEGSRAEKAGFKAGDVIIRIGKETIENTEDVWDALDGYKNGETAEFEIVRKGAHSTLSMNVDQDRRDRWFRFRSDLPGNGIEFHNFDFDGGPGDLRMEHNQWEQSMKDFGRSMKSWGKELRQQLLEMRNQLRTDLRAVGI